MAGDGGATGFVGIGAHARGECANARRPDRTRPAAGDIADDDENVFFPSRLLYYRAASWMMFRAFYLHFQTTTMFCLNDSAKTFEIPNEQGLGVFFAYDLSNPYFFSKKRGPRGLTAGSRPNARADAKNRRRAPPAQYRPSGKSPLTDRSTSLALSLSPRAAVAHPPAPVRNSILPRAPRSLPYYNVLLAVLKVKKGWMFVVVIPNARTARD
uniref:Uncharacterized protein n=1 Tax=Plectus sambesii TaxID=2011161 RepID=A0A914XC52_9BILA